MNQALKDHLEVVKRIQQSIIERVQNGEQEPIIAKEKETN